MIAFVRSHRNIIQIVIFIKIIFMASEMEQHIKEFAEKPVNLMIIETNKVERTDSWKLFFDIHRYLMASAFLPIHTKLINIKEIAIFMGKYIKH